MEGPARELQEVVGATLKSVHYESAGGWMTLRFDNGESSWYWDIRLDAARPLQEHAKEARNGA